MKQIKSALLITLCILIGGCASIAGNNSRAVHVNSYPSGAAVYIDNQQYGVTPATVTLPSYIYGGKTITVRKRGYADQTRVVNTQFQPIAILDILFWPALIVDAATGNLVKIDPSSTNLNLNLHG